MSDAYSYTTVVVEPDGTSRISVSLRPDGDMSVVCPTGRDRAQISVSHAAAHVLIGPAAPEAPTVEDVRVARKLAESFAVYAAEVARLHAAQAEVGESSAA